MPGPGIVSCDSCRDRKVKCDRDRPVCGKCARAMRKCVYQERRLSMKARRDPSQNMAARLALLESRFAARASSLTDGVVPHIKPGEPDLHMSDGDDESSFETTRNRLDDLENIVLCENNAAGTNNYQAFTGIVESQELIRQGLDESFPPDKVRQELFNIYFDHIHPCMPIIHKSNFQTALKLDPGLRPPLSLLYAIWSVAASASQKYRKLDESLYQKSRIYAEAREMKGYDSANITVYDAQCWHLIATFEAQKTYAARAFMSTGKCLRLVQIMGLYHIDRAGLNATMIPTPAKDFIELEEMRRTFWAAFIGDRWASICTGWTMTMNESEIFTNLLCSEPAFNEGLNETTISLAEALADDGVSSLPSSFSGLAVAITLLGRNLIHIHNSPEESCAIKRADSQFWRRHREMDNTISNTFLYLPTRLKPPQKFQDPNAVFLSMTLQASSLCLHLAAIRKSMRSNRDSSFIRQSMDRCITGAHAITATIRAVTGHDLPKVNSWTGFCLYVAGLVYCLNLKFCRPPTPDGLSNLNFLLKVMKSIAECHPITEYFIAQLEHELSVLNTTQRCLEVSVIFEPPGQNFKASAEAMLGLEEGIRSLKLLYLTNRSKISSENSHPQLLVGVLDANEDCICRGYHKADDNPPSSTFDSSVADLLATQEQNLWEYNAIDPECIVHSHHAKSFHSQAHNVTHDLPRAVASDYPQPVLRSFPQLARDTRISPSSDTQHGPIQSQASAAWPQHEQSHMQAQQFINDCFEPQSYNNHSVQSEQVNAITDSEQLPPFDATSAVQQATNDTSRYHESQDFGFGIFGNNFWGAWALPN